jgi:hypothetical protein
MEHFGLKNIIEELSITLNEIEAAIKSIPKKKTAERDIVSAEFYQPFKEELTPTLFKLFHEMKGNGHCPCHSTKPI